MKRDDLADLATFAAIAEERSFTRAAARLDVSVSALSHSLRLFESRIGVKLLHRTTRSVSPTEAGERLLQRLGPALGDIDDAFGALADFRDVPAGRVRVNTHRMAAINIIAPRLAELRARYPDVVVELSVDDGRTDIVAAGFDAGIRPGEFVAKDMISVRIAPDSRAIVVGSPGYFSSHPQPAAPEDLARHDCIAYRQISGGGVYRWQFANKDRTISVAVEPAFITDDVELTIRAALDGVGLAYVIESQVGQLIADGRLIAVLDRWSMPFSGDFLYYSSRRQVPPALRVLIDTLRFRQPG